MVKLVSSDNQTFTVDRDVAERSVLLRTMLEDLGELDEPIPLSNVSSSVLEKIIEYCEYHRNDPLPDPVEEFAEDDTLKRSLEMSEWDREFMKTDDIMVFELVLAANYLDIKPLLEIGCKTVADMIKNKSTEEIRRRFNLPDLEPEAEAAVKVDVEAEAKKGNEWVGRE